MYQFQKIRKKSWFLTFWYRCDILRATKSKNDFSFIKCRLHPIKWDFWKTWGTISSSQVVFEVISYPIKWSIKWLSDFVNHVENTLSENIALGGELISGMSQDE